MPLEKIYAPRDVSWGEVAIIYRGKEISFPLHISSGAIFNHDPSSLIRLKNMGLVLITPLITLIRSIYWAAKTAILAVTASYCFLEDEEFSEESYQSFTEAATDTVRAWKYGTLMTGCALAGIAVPFWARLQYGSLERELNRHSDGPHRNKLYTAICFQPLCTLDFDDQLNDENAAMKLDKYLARVDAIDNAFKTFAWNDLIKELS